jgi:hypothetical protein
MAPSRNERLESPQSGVSFAVGGRTWEGGRGGRRSVSVEWWPRYNETKTAPFLLRPGQRGDLRRQFPFPHGLLTSSGEECRQLLKVAGLRVPTISLMKRCHSLQTFAVTWDFHPPILGALSGHRARLIVAELSGHICPDKPCCSLSSKRCAEGWGYSKGC